MKNNLAYHPYLHPFLFLLASIFSVYQQAVILVSPGMLVRPIVFITILLAASVALGQRVLRDRNSTGFLLTVLVLGLWSSSSFFKVASVVLTIILLVWVSYSLVRKWTIQVRQAVFLLNSAGLILALVGLRYPISVLATLPPAYYQLLYARGRPAIAGLTAPAVPPDIYYIVLDGYVRSDMLQELYGYDNSDFAEFLEEREFIIPAESRSNYPKTALSIPSTLNMDYVSSILPNAENKPYWWMSTPLIDHSTVRKSLEGLGYKTISVMTDWSITDNPTTDMYFHSKAIVLNDFENLFLRVTSFGMVEPLFSPVVFSQSHRSHYELISYQFDTLAAISGLQGPKFVFVHITSPHPPFVVDAEGSPRFPTYSFSFNDANDFPLDAEAYQQGYINQLRFVNEHLVDLVNSLLENSSTPPIIILQADHGSGLLTDFRSSENTCLKERFSIFAAYHLPGLEKKDIPNDITSVNLFRIILNHYFGGDLPMLERAHYYYKDTVYIFRTEDVTSRVDTCAGR